jgi:preprotein translocase subunit SecD
MKVTIQADFNAWAEMKGRQPSDDEKEALMQGALDTLMNRLDKFGLAEIVIRRQGVDTIVVELPGAADPERIRRVIIGKGRLSFHLVDVDAVGRFITYQATHPGPYLDEELNIIDPELKELIGEGLLLRKVYEKDEFGLDRHTDYTVIYETPGLEGEYIEDAGIRTDPITNDVYVTFRLSDEGGDIFYDFTNQNVNKILAVVLDDKVKMSARIKQAIRNDVQVEGTFTLDEARDLALILKTGALPVPLEIISQESEGASLGEDTIDRGIKAIIWGLIFVMAFMLLYYKGGGIIACLALSVNFFLLASILSVFNFTLTLTSIAGFILTVGMSVDANVIIFERIKEEYHLGKTRAASITAGFSKAFWTITDANVTTGIAAVILASFGKGPIQGFAVVLATGVVCSMITALFFSRLLFDFITDVFKPLRISMSWRSAQ